MAASSLRARNSTVFQRWYQPDEAPALRGLDDSSGWQPPQWPTKAAVASLAAIPLFLWVDSDYAQPPPLRDDHLSTWQAPVTNLPKPQLATFWEQDEIPAAAAPLTVPGNGLPNYGQRERVQTKFQRWYTQDELPTFTAAIADDDAGFRPVGLASSPLVVVWAEDEGIVPQSSPLPIDELYWQAPFTQRAAPNLQIWLVDDVITQFLLVDDDSAGPMPGRALQAITSTLWAEDDQIVPQVSSFAIEPDAWQVPIVVVPKMVLAQPWIDAEFVPVVAPAPIVDDDAWQPSLAWRAAPTAAVWTQQDECVPLPVVPLPVDLDFMWLELRPHQPPPDLRLFQDDGNFTQAPTYTYTHDSRERVGGRRGRAKKGRIGPSNEGSGRQ